MKRIHLFEFEDFSWFPGWMRDAGTRLIVVMHKLLKTDRQLAEILIPVMKKHGISSITDLCSGGGGPMPDVYKRIKEEPGLEKTELILTDLFPNKKAAERINQQGAGLSYKTEPVDAAQVGSDLNGMRTMVGSFHHMRPETGQKILKAAFDSKQPICIFELSDNSSPTLLWWLAIPFNAINCLFITPMSRPLTLLQVIFTYIIPLIPLFFAWDGAVSNARTYTKKDFDILLKDLRSHDYHWEYGKVPGVFRKSYLLGTPTVQN
jgi:hypothetical protein